MSSNKKIALTTGVLILLIIITAASIIAIFAAAQQTVNSEVSVTYKSENVSGTASAKYYVGEADKTGTPMRVNGEAQGETSIDFNSKNPIETQTLSPVEKEIKLSEENYFVVFEYYFTNTNSQNDYMVKLSTSDSTIKNMKFLTEMNYEKVSDWQIYEDASAGFYSNEVSNLNLTEIVPANKELYMYVIAKIDNLDNDADFKLNFNWELGQIKATPEKLSFEQVEDHYVVKQSSAEISGDVVIPAQVGGIPVTEIAGSAFSGNSNITSIVIPEGITKIGNSAFASCSGLTSVVIPNSVKEIGRYAFDQCNLKTLVIGEGVETINNCAFEENMRLTKIYFNSINVTNYPTDNYPITNPFRYSFCLKFIITDSVTDIPNKFLWGSGGWSGFSYIYYLTIGKNVATIGDDSFIVKNMKCVTINSPFVYNNLTDLDTSCGGLLSYCYEEEENFVIKISKSIVNDPANSNTLLNNPERFNKDEIIDEEFVLYTYLGGWF